MICQKKNYKGNIQKKIVASDSRSRIMQFNKGMDAIIQTMSGFFAKWYTKMRMPLHPDPDRSIQKEEYYRLLRCCPGYQRAVSKMIPKLAGLSYHFDRSKFTHPDLVYLYEKIFDNIKNFHETRARLALTRMEGRVWLRMDKDVRDYWLPISQRMIRLLVPIELKFEPKELYELQTQVLSSEHILAEWTYGNLATGSREAITPDEGYNLITNAYLPEIRNEFQGEALNSYIIQLVESIQVLTNYALVYAEKKAEVHVAIKSNFTNLLSEDLQNYISEGSDASVARLKKIVEYFITSKNGGALLLGPEDEVSVLDTAGRTDGIYRGLIEMLDNWLEQEIVVMLGGDMQGQGSLARAESTRQEQNDVLAWYQKYLVEEPCNELVKKIFYDEIWAVDAEGEPLLNEQGQQFIIHSNYSQLYKAGLIGELPKFKLGEVGKEEPRDLIPTAQAIFQMGGGLVAEEFYEKMGWTMPPDTPAVLKQPQQPQMMGGMMPGMSGNSENADMSQVQPDTSNALMSEALENKLFSANFKETKKKTIKELLEEARILLADTILTKINMKRRDKNNKNVDAKLKEILTYISILMGIQAAKDLEKELQDKEPVVKFSEAYFDDTSKASLLNKKIQKRLEEDWIYGKLDSDINSFNVVFEEALKDILEAEPFLANTAEEIRQQYEQAMIQGKSVFSVLFTDTLKTVKDIQKEMETFLKTGKREEAQQNIKSMLDSTTAYANVVFKTNSATAYSIGRQIQQKPLVDNGFIVGFEIQTAGDGRVRGRPDGVYKFKPGMENHWALEGTRLRADNPKLDGLTPPFGYLCRCILRAITKYAAEDKGYIDKDGKFIEYFPPTFNQAKIHKGFGRRYKG